QEVFQHQRFVGIGGFLHHKYGTVRTYHAAHLPAHFFHLALIITDISRKSSLSAEILVVNSLKSSEWGRRIFGKGGEARSSAHFSKSAACFQAFFVFPNIFQ